MSSDIETVALVGPCSAAVWQHGVGWEWRAGARGGVCETEAGARNRAEQVQSGLVVAQVTRSRAACCELILDELGIPSHEVLDPGTARGLVVADVVEVVRAKLAATEAEAQLAPLDRLGARNVVVARLEASQGERERLRLRLEASERDCAALRGMLTDAVLLLRERGREESDRQVMAAVGRDAWDAAVTDEDES